MGDERIERWIKEEMAELEEKLRYRALFDRYDSDESFKKLIDFLIESAHLPEFETLEDFEGYPSINGGENVYLQFKDDEGKLEIVLDDSAGGLFARGWIEESSGYEDDNGSVRVWDEDSYGMPQSVGSGEYDDPVIYKDQYELSIAVTDAECWLVEQLSERGIDYIVEAAQDWNERNRSSDFKYFNDYRYSGFTFKRREN